MTAIFLDRVVSRIFAFQEDGSLKQYEGGFSDYADTKEREDRENGSMKEDGREKKKEKTQKPRRQEKLKFTYQEQKEYETIEDEIASMEEIIGELDRQIEASATDFMKLSSLTEEKERLSALLEEKMERYVYLADLAAQIENEG